MKLTPRTRRRRAHRLYVVGCLTLAAGGVLADACALPRRLRRADAPDPVATTWAATLDTTRAALAGGRSARADSVLRAFRERNPDAPQSAEALYWRALARLELATSAAGMPSGGVRQALADLDAYRATPAPQHLAEAVVLRRAVAQLDSARAVTVVVERSAPPPPPQRPAVGVSRDSARALDEELQRARADAASARAELDRVRRRLAAPLRRP